MMGSALRLFQPAQTWHPSFFYANIQFWNMKIFKSCTFFPVFRWPFVSSFLCLHHRHGMNILTTWSYIKWFWNKMSKKKYAPPNDITMKIRLANGIFRHMQQPTISTFIFFSFLFIFNRYSAQFCTRAVGIVLGIGIPFSHHFILNCVTEKWNQHTFLHYTIFNSDMKICEREKERERKRDRERERKQKNIGQKYTRFEIQTWNMSIFLHCRCLLYTPILSFCSISVFFSLNWFLFHSTCFFIAIYLFLFRSISVLSPDFFLFALEPMLSSESISLSIMFSEVCDMCALR